MIIAALLVLPSCRRGDVAEAAPAGASTSTAPPPPAPTAPRRIVAVGDLHADLDNALAILKLAGLVDETGAWAGGDTIFVQTGDVTDRGADSKEIIELLMRLQKQAPASGGRVVPVLGNHEIMNLSLIHI